MSATTTRAAEVRAVHPADTRAGQLAWADATIRENAVAQLAPRLHGPLFLPGDAGYDDERSGYNTMLEHRPAVVVGADGPADVMAAVAFATTHGLPVGVLSTGHGAAVAADGALLVSTRRMQGVRVDPFNRVARVEAGVRWDRVIHEAAAFGLAPLSGSAPHVGVVGYTLGGGLGLLGRSFGYAADHVRGVDIVTAHGMQRQVSPQQYADLFWALRGGKGNFGVVTSLEIDLFPVPRLYGGGLYFRASSAPQVFNAYRRWARSLPDAMTSSIALTRFPWQPQLPDRLRGRFVVHVRIAYNGTAAEGERLVRPLREAAVTMLDTVAEMPYTASGSIHADPLEPFGLYERTAYLRELDEDAVDALVDLAGPDSTCPMTLVELRHLGGALGRAPEVPNAVGHRDAGFLLYLAAVCPPADPHAVAGYADEILARLAPWTTGGAALNFMGTHDAAPARVRSAYTEADYRRIVGVKRAYDPENVFRVNHNIPPSV
ncbi:FAD-binding oxidoreductase [Dactylosporangium sp. NPDC049525]|uniref:FAD-binding oxidoreductase n=1 Tax=Dactylosporangium sp. NPDC049525 TaxID=3154730 RepID=UPI00343EC978